MIGWALWGAQVTTLRIAVAAILELAIVGYFWLCWRLFGR
jgi:hypothetical protein